MRAATINSDRSFELTDIAERMLEPHELRLDVAFCGICGSDLHNKFEPDLIPAGSVLGHEFSGTVSEVGTAVTNFAVGDRVAVLPFEYCGECDRCRAGLEHVCARRKEVKIGGAFRFGAYAESVIVPASTAFELPETVSLERGALAEPVAVGIHAVRTARVAKDDPVVVLGAGPIGVMTAMALMAGGYTRFVGVEPNQSRRERLAALGVPMFGMDDPRTEVEAKLGALPVAVFDATGHPSGIETSFSLLPARGRLVLLGYTVDPAPFNTYYMVVNETEVVSASAYTHDEFREAIEHLAMKSFPAEQIITSVRPIGEVNEIFDDLGSGRSDDLKVLLHP